MEIIENKKYTLISYKEDIQYTKLPDMKEELYEILENNKIYCIDFKNIDYIDSSGIGLIISLYKDLKEMDSELYLININNEINEIFSLVFLNQIIKYFDSEDSFIEYLESK